MQNTIVDKLVKHLKKCDDAYYNKTPLVSDHDYDKMRDKLHELDPNNTYFSNVGAPIKGVRQKHKHANLIGSLNKVKTKEEFYDWATDKGDLFCLSMKYDGSTVVATYKEGVLQALATRGDGRVGENVTDNADKLGVPSKLTQPFSGELRGEAILRTSIFNEHFKPQGYKNPRNAANGKVRDQKDDPLINYCEVVWFDILPENNTTYKNMLLFEKQKWEAIFKLTDAKNTQKFTKFVSMPLRSYGICNKEEIWKNYELFNDKRDGLDWEIDGLVCKVNNVELQESFGVVSNRPKGAIAIKFPSVGSNTYLKRIEWNRGLTGIYAPVGILEPIDIGGVTISRVSLCGIDEINRLDIAPGDLVYLSRRNDVIPKVEYVEDRTPSIQLCKDCNNATYGKELAKCEECNGPVKSILRTKVRPPQVCKECRADLILDGAYLICRNTECQGEIYGNLMTWLQRTNIKGIGSSTLRALIEEGVTDIAKLYRAPEDIFVKATNSEKLGHKAYEAIQKSQEVRLSVFLSGLSISSLGKTNGTRIEKKLKTLNNVLKATADDFKSIEGIKTNADKIYDGLQKKSDLINELSILLNIKDLDQSGPLAGSSFCITGNLSKPRPVIHELIRSLGGEVKTGVSKGLTYLITNTPDSTTSKNKKAIKYDVKRITEEEFYKFIG